MSTDDDAADGQDRIDQLERVVREQQRELEALAETLGIENPKEEAKTYSRRAALGLGAAGVAGAAGYATGSAQADPNNTQEGTIGNGDEDLDVQDIAAKHVASNSINTEEVSRNVGHAVDVLIYRGSGGTAYAVDQHGNQLGSDADGSLPNVVRSALDAEGNRTHMYITAGGQSGFTAIGAPCVIPENNVTLELGPRGGFSVFNTPGTVGPDNLSTVFDFRSPGGQTEAPRVIGHGTPINARGNADVVFYFADAYQARVEGILFDNVVHSPYRFANEEGGSTGQFCTAYNYALYSSDGTVANYGGEFISITDAYAEDWRVSASDAGILFDSTPKIDCNNGFLTDRNVAQGAAVRVDAATGTCTGEVENVRTEATDLDAVLDIQANGGNVERFNSKGIWHVLGAQATSVIRLAENSGGIGRTQHSVKADAASGGNPTKIVEVAAGSPFMTKVWTTHGFNQSGIADAIDKGPNSSKIIVNGLAWEPNNPQTNEYPSGTIFRNTSNDSWWIFNENGGFTQFA